MFFSWWFCVGRTAAIWGKTMKPLPGSDLCCKHSQLSFTVSTVQLIVVINVSSQIVNFSEVSRYKLQHSLVRDFFQTVQILKSCIQYQRALHKQKKMSCIIRLWLCPCNRLKNKMSSVLFEMPGWTISVSVSLIGVRTFSEAKAAKPSTSPYLEYFFKLRGLCRHRSNTVGCCATSQAT